MNRNERRLMMFFLLLGDPLMDLSSKCAVDLAKNGISRCVEKEWASTCPHSCRGALLSCLKCTKNRKVFEFMKHSRQLQK